MIADTWPSALIILLCAFVLLPLLVGALNGTEIVIRKLRRNE